MKDQKKKNQNGKDRKRKKREWDNECYIMKKYGSSIRMAIERTFRKAAANQIKHKTLKVVADATRLPAVAYKDKSKKVSWVIN